ncbi:MULTISPECIES: TetR/AcrR family transcriptional regulator [Olivibacter]|uniref:TetR/AcrR family transcriptional regulator n=2 Tax=Olivibacter TaxID=376469 RepID=A0ABV6HKD1_9SPHI|nr:MULTISPECIES: TetR/AcrR family transcriptional regulator [Olivibacter]MCL4638958.1 TetR/AcrR family transcriptional regulator [Olivibacter sp. UJ_SKK_5.1]MDM8175372.1 TetR/AcrR family transcriptional regulator [Olivibacter sp. 47]MDX3913987.1 TetR/AcrR family transcriptional regulator [Pseudosphingobacterium sp.]QEL02134.1 TetR/AcrR family transcriptional regulator [Olivibacter sp. LS-1]
MENTSEKKQVILDNMLELIEEHGLLGVPMSMLSKKAGVAAGTIYHYFDSKDAIILELFDYVRDSISHEIFRIKDRSMDNYSERFKSIWINLFQYFVKYPKVLSFMEQFYSSPFQRIVQSTESQFYEDNFSSFFTSGMEAGFLKKYGIHIVSSVFMGGLIIAAKKQNNGYHNFTESELKAMASIMWDGLKI